MEYAKDEFFKIDYKTNCIRMKGENKTEATVKKIIKKMCTNKLLTTSVIAFIIFSLVNFIMIYNFMRILQNI